MSRRVAAFLAATVLAGCAGTGRRAPQPVSTPRAGVVRGCDAAHTGVGFGGVSATALRDSLRVGPLALGALGALTRSQLPAARPGQQRFVAIESIAVIRAGAIATVSIAPADRRHAGLIYDQRKFRADGSYRIADLDAVVRFEACRDRGFNHGSSQFDGGLVVAGRRCVRLDVQLAGRRFQRPAFADCGG